MTLAEVITASALLATLVGIVGTSISSYKALRPVKGSRLSYHVYSDRALGRSYAEGQADLVFAEGQADLVLRYRDRLSGVYKDADNPSLAQVGIRNDGGAIIRGNDFDQPITITFKNREVLNAKMDEPGRAMAGGSILYRSAGVLVDDQGTPTASRPKDLVVEGDSVFLPKVLINRKDGFKLSFLLSGTGTKVALHANFPGDLKEDTGDRDQGRHVKRALVWGASSVTFLAAALIVTLARPGNDTMACASGHISVEGSSAFAPAISEIAIRYQRACPSSTIDVIPTDSYQAVDDLVSTGKSAARTKPGAISIAMSDGWAPDATLDLVFHPEGIVLFSVVVNSSTGIHSLTLREVQAIYYGRVQNWDQLHGRNQAILFGDREGTSGTRNIFDSKILGSQSSSRLPAIERTSTREMLRYVNDTPGAIGYAEATAASDSQDFPNVVQVQLGGINPSPESVKNDRYPFWTVEYFYTYGAPSHGSLTSAFLSYLTSDTSRAIMQDLGHIPCQDEQGGTLVLCTAHS